MRRGDAAASELDLLFGDFVSHEGASSETHGGCLIAVRNV